MNLVPEDALNRMVELVELIELVELVELAHLKSYFKFLTESDLRLNITLVKFSLRTTAIKLSS
jgi:hypothetical protein